MFRRFAAAAGVASVAIALGSLTLLLMPAGIINASRLTAVWCFVPAVWGLWAMLAPRQWVPGRLPAWGALLGVVGGLIAIFVLNLPRQFFGAELTATQRGLGVLLAVVFYYFLWMVVRGAWLLLAKEKSAPQQ